MLFSRGITYANANLHTEYRAKAANGEARREAYSSLPSIALVITPCCGLKHGPHGTILTLLSTLFVNWGALAGQSKIDDALLLEARKALPDISTNDITRFLEAGLWNSNRTALAISLPAKKASLIFVFFGAVTILIGGCAIPRKHGDAWVYDRKDFPFVVVDDLVFPWMRLDSRRTYRFEVRRLPRSAYPDRIELRYPHEARRPSKVEETRQVEARMSRDEIQRTNRLWRETVLKVRFHPPLLDQTPFERVISFKSQRSGPYYDENRRTAVLRILSDSERRSLPGMTDYIVEVEIISAAKTEIIEARLFTQTKIY